MIRTLFERLVRGRTVWRRLPNGRKIAVSPDAQLKYLGWHFDEDLSILSRRMVSAGDVVWDIGANCGTFAFSCDLAAAVVAVEADPFLCELLERSDIRNGGVIQLIRAAISDGRGTAEFSIAARGRASNHLSAVGGSTQTGGERSKLTVETYSLDDLLGVAPPPDFVKIDIEGAELFALQGAKSLLQNVRPLIYIEIGAENERGCLDLLSEAKYSAERYSGSNWIARPCPDRLRSDA